MSHNKDYTKELPTNSKIFIISDRTCPRCFDKLVVLPPDRVWCINKECDYGEMHLIGKGVYEQPMEELNNS